MWPSMTQQRTKGPGSAGGPPKENLGTDDEPFGYLRTQIPAHQPYGSLSSTTSMNDNPYLAPAGNYYPFPYGLGDGNTAWSSGGEPMFSFGNYGHAGSLAAAAVSGHAAAGHAAAAAPGNHLHAGGHQTNDHHHTSIYGAAAAAAAAGSAAGAPGAADFGSSFGAYGSHHHPQAAAAAAPGFSYFPSAGEYDTWGTGGRTKAYDDYYRTPTAQQQQQQQQQQHSLGPLAASVSASSNSTSSIVAGGGGGGGGGNSGPFDYSTVNGDAAGSSGGGGSSIGFAAAGSVGSNAGGVGLHDGLKSPLDQTMGGLTISGGGDKGGVLPHIGVGGVVSGGGVGDGGLVSPKDLFGTGPPRGVGVGMVGVDGGVHHGLSGVVGGGSSSGGAASIGGVTGVGLGSPHSSHLMAAASVAGGGGNSVVGGGVGISGSGLDGSIPPGPGGLGTSGGVGGLISSGGGSQHHVGGSGGVAVHGGSGGGGGPVSSPKQASAPQQQQQQQQAPPAGPQAAAPPAKKSWASIASQPAKPQPKVIKAKAIPPAPILVTRNAGNMDIGTWGETTSTSSTNNRSEGMKDGKAGGGAGGGGGGGAPRNAWGTAPRQGAGRDAVGGGVGGGPKNSSNNNNNNRDGNMNNSAAQTNGGKGGVGMMNAGGAANNGGPQGGGGGGEGGEMPTVLKELMGTHKYNPKDYNLNPKNARFFVIKSYSEDDIHRSIKYGIWCSTEHGNKRLDDAFRSQESKGAVLLFYSVNGSGHFCGMAQMMGHVDYDRSSSVWLQDKWKGQFEVKWIYVKDVPNSQLRHIRLENNENKPVTNSRDTQEILGDKGKQVLKIIHQYKHSTSIFDDFGHYEKRQEVETIRDVDSFGAIPASSAAPTASKPPPAAAPAPGGAGGPNNQQRK